MKKQLIAFTIAAAALSSFAGAAVITFDGSQAPDAGDWYSSPSIAPGVTLTRTGASQVVSGN
ncbi:MAG: hypothetical protein EOP85_17935, partial [Verrucomicrobiaceae bacterium]